MAELAAAAVAEGEEHTAYEGSVRRAGDPAVHYRYERRVRSTDGGTCASHVTTTPGGGPVVLHRAEQGPNHELRTFREVHGQTGDVGWVHVAGGKATFGRTRGGRTRQRVEALRAPLVVGPTLFGHLRRHLDVLKRGEALHLRLAVPSMLRSLGVRARHVPSEGDTVVELRPTDPFVALFLAPMQVVYDETGRVVRFEGRVPPLDRTGRRPRPLDAVVSYAHRTDSRASALDGGDQREDGVGGGFGVERLR